MATNTETTTTTTTETATTIEESKELKNIHYAVFLAFAEFLGYESPLIEWAEELCKGKMIELYKQHALVIDAKSIYQKMQKEYTPEEIRGWYDQFYDCILNEYDDAIHELFKDDLPF